MELEKIDYQKKFNRQHHDFLKIIDKGENMMDYFSQVDPICHDIGKGDRKLFRLTEKLGSGGYGEVWALGAKMLPAGLPKRMAVKKVDAEVMGFDVGTKEARAKVIKFFDREVELTDFDFDDPLLKTIALPSFLFTPCKEGLIYYRADNKERVILPKGSMICPGDFVEFAIGVYVGEFYLRSVKPCINFLPVYYFAVCAEYDTIKANYYTFMEQIDRTYSHVLRAKYDAKVFDHILIQVLFAIAFYQHNGNIVHGDLHSSNVFLIKRVMPIHKDLEFGGVKLADIDYFEYKINDRLIYLPGPKTDFDASQFIVKIGDWGTSVKFSPPLIGDIDVFEKQYTYPKPNWYNRAYDVLTVVRSAYIDRSTPTKLMKKILLWTENEKYTGIASSDDAIIQRQLYKTAISKDFSHFINIKLLESNYSHVNPDAILLNDDFMADYLKVPPAGSTIVRFGEI